MINKTNALRLALVVGVATLLVPFISVYAHHGTTISYDMRQEWTLDVIVTDFRYINPHPTMTFDIIDAEGNVEHWVSELRTNPARMLRAGWGRTRTEEALESGTPATLSVAPSRAGLNSGLVNKIIIEGGIEVPMV